MKTAIVTGASYGIGQAIAELLLQEGWKVYGLSRSKPKFDNQRFAWLQCDLSRSKDIQTSVAAIDESKLDALISNAGVFVEEKASATSQKAYEHTFSVNVLAPMLLVSGLRDKIRHATIISISSASDRWPNGDYSLYCSSKAANTMYFNSLAKDLKTARIYTLCPDYVDTPMIRGDITDPDFKWDEIIQPKDIAKLCDDLIVGRCDVPSGTNIIVVTEALKDTFVSVEKLYGFNTDTNELTKL